MKKIKRCVAIILSMVLGFSMSTVSFASERYNQNANSKGTCSKEDVDLSNGSYTIIYEDGELYIVPSQETRMGGGIGHCTVKNKTFSYYQYFNFLYSFSVFSFHICYICILQY